MPSADHLRLDLLPLEIIRTIAAFTPAENVVTLSRVNHALRAICYDPLVFRSCLEYSLSHMRCAPRSISESGKPSSRVAHVSFDVDLLTTILGTSVQGWARYAVANSLALYWGNDTLEAGRASHAPRSTLTDDAARHFVPHLLVLGHPWLYEQIALKAHDFMETLSELTTLRPRPGLGSPDRPVTRRASLEARSRALGRQIDDSASAFWFCLSALSDSRSICEEVAKQMNFSFVHRVESLDQSHTTLASTMGTLSAWGWLLKDYLVLHPTDSGFEQPSVGTAARLAPSLEIFPWFTSLKEGGRAPVPFMTRHDAGLQAEPGSRFAGWDEWLQEQVQQLCTPASLAASAWCGYWSFERQRFHDIPAVEFADAVEGLNIRALQLIDAPVPGTRVLIGTYTEHAVGFHLEGWITPQGRFRLAPPGDFWAWSGWMTPFGLFGFWGSSDGTQSAGACYLWPMSWTEEYNKQRGARDSSGRASDDGESDEDDV